ncbi:hypothetical protein M9H77_30367 [Catharanthus roseus]|uniref:Uncharacterized protein n=1 Tax=Catharanthus roseus TaxID=4058 RepID=A0ACB9ZYW8_CATRO|nr:hypothetical protein M9H77_30367 [Catharanthus roseus]
MKQSLRNKFGVENHERQRQGQAKEKLMESSMGEISTKENKLSQAQDILDRKVIHHEKNTCTFVKKEKSREKKLKSVVSTKESEGKRKESESLIENHESLKEEHEKEKQNDIEKSEETKEEMSLMIFGGDKREEIKESCCDTSLPLISVSSKELLPTTCGTKPNHGMKSKEEGMGKELSIGFEYTSLSLSLNPFLLYHDFAFKELKLFLELYAPYVTLVGNVIVNLFTCDLAFDIDHILKCSSPCSYLEKQLLVSIVRINPSYHDLELLRDNIFFDLLVANFSSSCASMWSKIHIFFGSFVESGYDERVSWFPWSSSSDFHAKFKGKFVENCDYESSFLYAFMKNLYGFIPSIQLLSLVSHKFEFPPDEQKFLIVDGFLKALLLGNFHGFQFYYFHFKEFMWLLFCGKKINDSFKVLKVLLYDLLKTTFDNGVFELALKDLDEKLLYPISFIDCLLKYDILKDFLFQNTTSCVKLLNQSFGGILLYSLTFKEFLDELISLLYCKVELGGLCPLKKGTSN